MEVRGVVDREEFMQKVEKQLQSLTRNLPDEVKEVITRFPYQLREGSEGEKEFHEISEYKRNLREGIAKSLLEVWEVYRYYHRDFSRSLGLSNKEFNTLLKDTKEFLPPAYASAYKRTKEIKTVPNKEAIKSIVLSGTEPVVGNIKETLELIDAIKKKEQPVDTLITLDSELLQFVDVRAYEVISPSPKKYSLKVMPEELRKVVQTIKTRQKQTSYSSSRSSSYLSENIVTQPNWLRIYAERDDTRFAFTYLNSIDNYLFKPTKEVLTQKIESYYVFYKNNPKKLEELAKQLDLAFSYRFTVQPHWYNIARALQEVGYESVWQNKVIEKTVLNQTHLQSYIDTIVDGRGRVR